MTTTHHRVAVGHLVHYVASESAPYPRRRYPAIVVHVEDVDAGIVNLTVFNDVTPTGCVSRLRVAYSDEHHAGTWHIPEADAMTLGSMSQHLDVDL